MRKVITIDPGETSGIIVSTGNQHYGLQTKTHIEMWELLHDVEPKVIVFENFALRQSAAMKLIGNTFYTVEIIGVIKLYASLTKTKLVELQPVNKEYCGFSASARDPKYKEIILKDKISEHIRDAFRLFNYYRLFKEDK